jgi:hypothetical protein
MSDTRPYVVVENKLTGHDAIKLTEYPWEGIIYTYGKIEFEEDETNSTLHLKFDYEILDNNNKGFADKTPFEQYIGKILEDLIKEGVENNSLTYTGGVDENRTKDSEQSDS